MRNIILQLFLDRYKVRTEIEQLQLKSKEDWNKELVDAKHAEWDRIEHLIDIFFKSVGMQLAVGCYPFEAKTNCA